MSRKYPTFPIVGVGAVILKDDSILLIRRAQEPGEGGWSIPGGLVKLGETVREAVVREIFEETGLSISVGEVAGVYDYIQTDADGGVVYHYVIIDFYVNNFSGSPKASSDAVDIKWVKFSEVNDFRLTSTTKLLIQKIEKQLFKK
ncbi:MAG: NUDIX hydrolase [Candidatus Odinarchaeia archaeon]